MKYAYACVVDQTIAFFANDVSITIKHSEAQLFDDFDEALGVVDDEGWVVEVEDEAEFRARPDTW